MTTLTQVSAVQWIIEGWSTTRAQALATVRTYLVDERGLDDWDADDAMLLVRIDRTYYEDAAGFVYAGYPGGRPVIIVTGLPPLPGTELDSAAPQDEEVV